MKTTRKLFVVKGVNVGGGVVVVVGRLRLEESNANNVGLCSCCFCYIYTLLLVAPFSALLKMRTLINELFFPLCMTR